MSDTRERIALPFDAFTRAATGGTPIPDHAFEAVIPQLDVQANRELDDAAQVQELMWIRDTADIIEATCAADKMPVPNVFVVFTAGFDAPDDVFPLGTNGQDGPLRHLPQGDITGHLGSVGVLRIGEGHTALIANGRAHPYAGVGRPRTEAIYARPFKVMQELMRRNRERGRESGVILTYLTGVDERSPIKTGGLGVVVDYIEGAGGRSALHPGAGAHNFLDGLSGERFQSKLGRASDPKLAKSLALIAKELGIPIGAVAAVGTPGTTSFQGIMERVLYLQAFERAKTEGLEDLARETLGDAHNLSLFFNMSLGFEVDALRQMLHRIHPHNRKITWSEPDFPLLILVLPTDYVGAGSRGLDHGKVVDEAFSHGNENGKLIRGVIDLIGPRLNHTHILVPPPEWVGPLSLKKSLPYDYM